MKNNPIGIFDSGIGGTSILNEIHQLLPNENIIYLADSKNAPYGNKSKEAIIALSEKNTQWLLNHNCKIIVVACNTATTNAIAYLRKKYPIPFIGIEPAIKPAALKTKTKTIGILATKGTLSSALFHKTSELYAHNIDVIEQIGEGIVQLIEAGKTNSPEMETLLKNYLEPMITRNIDHLVLGCTHYPYLIPMLKKMLPNKVTIIDSGQAVAKQTKNVLSQSNLLTSRSNTGSVQLFSNQNIAVLSKITNFKYKATLLDF